MTLHVGVNIISILLQVTKPGLGEVGESAWDQRAGNGLSLLDREARSPQDCVPEVRGQETALVRLTHAR